MLAASLQLAMAWLAWLASLSKLPQWGRDLRSKLQWRINVCWFWCHRCRQKMRIWQMCQVRHRLVESHSIPSVEQVASLFDVRGNCQLPTSNDYTCGVRRKSIYNNLIFCIVDAKLFLMIIFTFYFTHRTTTAMAISVQGTCFTQLYVHSD